MENAQASAVCGPTWQQAQEASTVKLAENAGYVCRRSAVAGPGGLGSIALGRWWFRKKESVGVQVDVTHPALSQSSSDALDWDASCRALRRQS